MAGTAILGLVLWAGQFGLYLLFAGQASGAELYAGAPSALAAAGLAVLLARRPERRRYRLRAPWGRVLAASFGAVPADLVRVGRVLLHALLAGPSARAPGHLRRQDFAAGGDADARDAARRALVALAGSLAPNRFVLRERPSDAALLLHELAPSPASPDRVWPL